MRHVVKQFVSVVLLDSAKHTSYRFYCIFEVSGYQNLACILHV